MIRITANKITININNNGYIEDIVDSEGISLFSGKAAPFLKVGVGENILYPVAATKSGEDLYFEMEENYSVHIAIKEKPEYTTIMVRDICDECDSLIFGPFPTILGETIGEVIGVVREKGFAIGIQAINMKTIAGFPWEYRDVAYKEYASNKNMSDISVAPLDYFKSAAYRVRSGSILQLYCNDRSRMRIRNVMECDSVPVPPIEGPNAKIIGAGFALFGCREEDVLSVIEEIELGEGLPHPTIDGEWVKTSRQAMRSYLIAEFGKHNFDKIADYAKAAEFREVYHPDPFSNWGHFTLRKDHFPEGDESLIELSQRGAKMGIGLGLHTLTNFTTTNDPYITPIPHKNLAIRGESEVVSRIDENDETITVSSKEIFEEVSYLSTVWIGDELIQYSGVSEENVDIILTGCKRGAFGTIPREHKAGEKIKKLWDHGYKIFFPDAKLQDKYADRLVELFNKASLVQISFDGLEGCRYTGEDEYAVNRFCMRCWDGWEQDVINDASQLNHNLWHMNTRMNWGEPWGAKMREGMMGQRINNQEFYRKNLFPRMLGWFLVRAADRKFEATTISDIEWMLSKAAGFDAGFALVSNEKVLDSLGVTNEILKKVRMWEKLRLKDAFSDELKEELKCPQSEWCLEDMGNQKYNLIPQDTSQTYTCDLLEMQPGQPGGADWMVDNKLDAEGFSCNFKIDGDGYIENPTLTTSSGMIRFECRVEGRQYLFFDGKEDAYITDRNYNRISKAKVHGRASLQPGLQPLSFYCDFGGDEAPEVRFTMVISGAPHTITL